MVDYTRKPLWFRIRKLLRYFRLYGIRRTLAKVRGQYHMKRTFETPPELRPNPDGHVGLLGCGNFAYSVIAYYLKKNYGRVMRGAMDVDVNRAMSLASSWGLEYFTDDPQRIIEDPRIDLVYIASNHASHAEYAIEALAAGKSVHIEKPHVVNDDQLVRLCRQMAQSPGRVGLGFNRPNSRIGRMIRSHLADQPGAMMLNWFVAGHEIDPDHWYFHEREGGRVLGNLCHWTDFIYQMIPADRRYPVTINPTRAERSDCDIAVTYVFGDGSIAVITFSAKGHTFEGVRESFSAHRGNALMAMSDFKWLTIEIVDRKIRCVPWFRDHGHSGAIEFSYEAARGDHPGCSVDYVWETADLFLRTKQALEENRPITVERFSLAAPDLSAAVKRAAVPAAARS
jgi:predicted dehydrogenase